MTLKPVHVRDAFSYIRKHGILPNKPSTKWDIIDPTTSERFPPKAVLRVAKDLANDTSFAGGGGWPTNNPLRALGFEIALKPDLEQSDEATDIMSILDSEADEATRLRLVNARLGQGGFRAALLEIWDDSCAITGCTIGAVLRASHIKAWRHSNNHEKLDPANGLLLAASIDALFDKHLITFTETGSMRASASLTIKALRALGIPTGKRLVAGEQTQTYLAHHRAEFEKASHGKSFEVE
jgi:putative restriction endonuclease